MSAQQQLTAIALVSAGRYEEAVDALEVLIENLPAPRAGRCRYCGCSEGMACSLVVSAGPEFQPAIVTCSWADEDRTVCSNVRCVNHWLADGRSRPDVLAPPADAPRIVLP